MFAPSGFVQLYEVSRVCFDLAYDEFPIYLTDDGALRQDRDPRAELYSWLILDRFIYAHIQEMWLFKYPDILLRASPELFCRTHTYLAPCPEDKDEAEIALEHLQTGFTAFVTARMRVDADGCASAVSSPEYQTISDELRPLHGALICWKPEAWPIDLRKAIWPFRDEDFFKGHPAYSQTKKKSNESSSLKTVYDDFLAVCPCGREASGLTWREVESRTGWSRRHILRAVGVFGGQADGQISGQSMGK